MVSHHVVVSVRLRDEGVDTVSVETGHLVISATVTLHHNLKTLAAGL